MAAGPCCAESCLHQFKTVQLLGVRGYLQCTKKCAGGTRAYKRSNAIAVGARQAQTPRFLLFHFLSRECHAPRINTDLYTTHASHGGPDWRLPSDCPAHWLSPSPAQCHGGGRHCARCGVVASTTIVYRVGRCVRTGERSRRMSRRQGPSSRRAPSARRVESGQKASCTEASSTNRLAVQINSLHCAVALRQVSSIDNSLYCAQ